MATLEIGKRVRLQNCFTKKNLRVNKSDDIDGNGGDGKYATWDVVAAEEGDGIRLRRFLAVFTDGRLHTGKGGNLCVFDVKPGKIDGAIALRAMHHPKSKKAHVGITKKGKPKCALKTRRGKNGCFIVEVVGDAETEEAIKERAGGMFVGGRAGPSDDFPAQIDPSQKKAVLFGCNYPGTNAALRGCVNDVFMMRDVLVKVKGFQEENIKIYIDTDSKYPRPTGYNMKRALQQLIGGSKKGDVLFIHFSGHGTQVPAEGPDHEADRKDEALVPCDMNLIVDDDLRKIMEKLPHGVHCTAVTDCCHSGGMLDHKEVQIGQHASREVPAAADLWGTREYEQTARDLPVSVIAEELTKQSGHNVKPENMRRSLFGLFGPASSSFASSFVGFFAEATGMVSYDYEESDTEDELEPEQDLFSMLFGMPSPPPDVQYSPQQPAPPSTSLMHLFGGSDPEVLFNGPLPPTVEPPIPHKPPIDEQLSDEKGVLICGCQSHQTSADCCPPGQPDKAYGALTNTLTKLVHRNPTISAQDLVNQVRSSLGRGGFSQQPGLECTDFHAGQQFICPSV